MKNLDILSAVLLFIGAINWGIIGLFNINVIDFLLRQSKHSSIGR